MTDISKDKGLDEDPGWRGAWIPRPQNVLLGVKVSNAVVQRSADSLKALRYIFVSFVWAVVGIGVVVAVLGDLTKEPDFAQRSIAVVVAAGLASLLAQRLFLRPLDCTSAKTLADTYRQRFFKRLAYSESVALIAFVMDIVWGPWWVYYVGAAFTLVGFANLAPTLRHLQLDQDQLSLTGCELSLTAALRTPTS